MHKHAKAAGAGALGAGGGVTMSTNLNALVCGSGTGKRVAASVWGGLSADQPRFEPFVSRSRHGAWGGSGSCTKLLTPVENCENLAHPMVA
jgi:hypothetical protein